jgi:hypothetical protein
MADDTLGLPGLLHRFQPWLDQRRWPVPREVWFGQGSPVGASYLTFAPDSTAPAASFNENRIYLRGTAGGLHVQGLTQMTQMFRERGIARFFVWLRPGPDCDAVAGWLLQAGFEPVHWTRYPTLLATNEPQAAAGTELTVREVGAEEVLAARAHMGEAISQDCAAAAGRDGVHHFMAFAGEQAVAVAALLTFEDMGYLSFAGTLPAFRGRQGAREAEVAHVLEGEQRRGCRRVVSETLTMLPHSMSNLQRLGFTEVYEQRVFRYGA